MFFGVLFIEIFRYDVNDDWRDPVAFLLVSFVVCTFLCDGAWP